MRKWMPLGAVVVLLAVSGCSAVPPESEPTATSTLESPTKVVSPAPTETSATTPPQECIDYDPGDLAADGPLADAAATAELPNGLILNPGLQVIPSTDDPDNAEVVARVCSAGVERADLIEAGNAIAKAIYEMPEHETVTLLMISSYVPTGEYLDQQPDLDVIQTDYELFLWDTTGRSLDSNWQ